MPFKKSAKSAILAVARRSATARRIAGLITNSLGTTGQDTYGYLRDCFIRLGTGHAVDGVARAEIVRRFEMIDRTVPISSTPTDGLILAQLLLATIGEGDVVECGCYAGGSSAKLSIVAHALGKKLVVFDSFEGLPDVDEYHLKDHHARRGAGWVTDWTAGRYAARLDEVKHNVERFGEIGNCTFVKGWFSDTLPGAGLPDRVCLAFTDVDIASSARDCIENIWPRLTEGAIFVSHDAAYIKVLQALHDEDMWRNRFNSFPPIFFGAGYGVYNSSPHIGYFVKGKALAPEYLKRLTLDQ